MSEYHYFEQEQALEQEEQTLPKWDKIVRDERQSRFSMEAVGGRRVHAEARAGAGVSIVAVIGVDVAET